MGGFKRAKTYDYTREIDPQTGETVLYMHVLKRPKNPEWGLLIGDMAHNLRSALDHLVWQLVLLNETKPKRRNQFPIISVEREYWEAPEDRSESVRDRMLDGVAEEHRAFIDLVQPYNAGNEAGSTSLSHLSWLSNVDKHRVIHGALLLTAEPSKDSFDISTPHPSGVSVDVKANWGNLQDGAEILRFSTDPPGAYVNVKAEFPAYIAFGDKQFPASAFKFLFDWVSRYIRGFEPIFRGGTELGPNAPISKVSQPD